MVGEPSSRRGGIELTELQVGLATLGVACLVGLGFAGHGPMRDPLTGIGVTCLVVAAVLLAWTARPARRGTRVTGDAPLRSSVLLNAPADRSPVPAAWSRRWPGWRAALVLGTLVTAITQTWFVSGTAIAGGDIAPPIGTAWIARLFEPWVWSGSNLGGPNTLATQLPWALVDVLVHGLGGSGALAQRLWLTALFVGAALTALWLLRLLGLSPTAAAVGALVYLCNPYVLTLGVNVTYVATLLLIVLWPAVVLAVATGRWRLRWGVVALAASAPLAGYVYANPPLLGLAVGGAIVAVLAAGWLYGRGPARRAALALGAGGILLVVLSLYWVVPSVIDLQHVSSGLSATGSWTWMESRSSVANGLWLNTSWGWSTPSYFPYAHLYDELPLSVLKYLLPAAAFAALVLVGRSRGSGWHQRAALVAGSALIALGLVVFGTGTALPGAVLFEPLYHLPYGWLLQTPGRFLMAAGLAYGALVGATIDATAEAIHARQQRVAAQSPLPERALTPRLSAFAGMLVAVVVVTAFPVTGGALVPTYGHATPSTRVRVPTSWIHLAAELNRQSPKATVLVLPPDDFYQMPYTWYYGNDGFITDLLSAHVIDPSGQGYSPSSVELLQVVDQVAAALLQHRWAIASDLVAATGANEILVRGDVVATDPGSTIVSPAALMRALGQDPEVHLMARSGPLRVYAARDPAPLGSSPPLATVDRASPDLAVLGDLPSGTALVSSVVVPGVDRILQPPPLSQWRLSGTTLRTDVVEPAGWHFHLRVLPDLQTGVQTTAATDTAAPVSVHVVRHLAGGATEVALETPVPQQLAVDGALTGGPWQHHVGNCADGGNGHAHVDLAASVVAGAGPYGVPALRLAAGADRACEAATVRWHTGPVLVTMDYRNVAGPEGPALCVWEVGPNLCAPTPALADRPGWHRLQMTVLPATGTTSIGVFVYASVYSAGQPRAVTEYADLAVRTLATAGQPVLIGTPDHASTVGDRLLLSVVAAGSAWAGPPAAPAVTVDGLRMGWLVRGPSSRASAMAYRYAGWIRDGQDASAVVASGMAVLVFAAVAVERVKARRRRDRRAGAPRV